MAIKLEDLQGVLNLVEIDQELKREILNKAQELEEEKKSERAAGGGRKIKKQMVVFLKSAEKIDWEVQAAAVELPEDVDYNEAWHKIRSAGVDHNLAQRKTANHVKRFRNFGAIKKKFQTQNGFKALYKGHWFPTVVVTNEEDENFISE